MSAGMPLSFVGDFAQVRFSAFDLAEYESFLTLKRTLPAPEINLSYDWKSDVYTVQFPARYAEQLGYYTPRAVDLLPMSDDLWDYQSYFTRWALRRKRAAFFWDCGLGKTRAFLEFGRQAIHLTDKKALIFSLGSNLIRQTIKQCKEFYGDALTLYQLESRGDLVDWLNNDTSWEAAPLCIVNYEKLIPGQIPELRNLGALILDESSILKTGGGKIKWNLIHSSKGIEYKLSNTATPAPNEAMEYASQASFLETIRTEGDVIWTYFKKNDDGSWRLMKNAEKAFYKFLSGWSVFMRSPAAYGFKDNVRPVPQPEYIVSSIEPTPQQMDEAQRYRFEIGAGLLGDARLGVKERLKLSQIAKGFIYEKSLTTKDTKEHRDEQSESCETDTAIRAESEGNTGARSCDQGLQERRSDGHDAGGRSQSGRISRSAGNDGNRAKKAAVVRWARRIPSLKPRKVAEIAFAEALRGSQVLIWTVFDYESLLISEALGSTPHHVLKGDTPQKLRDRYIDDFETGRIRVIVTNSDLMGYGMNVEYGSAMIFSGWNDSFEQWYQAIRRMVRYGQTESVRVYVPMIEGLEDAQLENVQGKAAAYEEQARLQEEAYLEALQEMSIG